MHHRKAAHRARAKHQQCKARDQGGDVGVQDRTERALVTRRNRRLRVGPTAQFLADAFVDQHVGINRHTEGQRDSRDARQGQRGLQQGEQGDQKQQIDRESQHRNGTKQQVVKTHEGGDGGETVERRVEAFLDVVSAERGADGALLDDLHGRRQRTRAQQQRDFGRFCGAHLAADLHPAAADFAADHRCGHYLAFAFFNQQNRHAFADVVAREVFENARALRVERQMHGGLLRLVVKPRLRIGEAVAGQLHLLAHRNGHAAAFGKFLAAERHIAGRHRGGFFRRLAHHAQFKRRSAAEDRLHLRGILHARQLHHDAVQALLLDHRFGDAERVDAVVEGGDVLLDRVFLYALFGFDLDGCRELEIGAIVAVSQCDIGERVGNHGARLRARGVITKLDDDRIALALHAGVADVFVAQQAAHVAIERVKALGQRCLHVYLIQKVYAAAQVEAEIHRQCV